MKKVYNAPVTHDEKHLTKVLDVPYIDPVITSSNFDGDKPGRRMGGLGSSQF